MTPAKLLVVDDEPHLLTILKLRLEALGYSVAVAEDGQTALSVAKDIKPDLVICDVMLPKLDGYGVCKAIKADELLNDTSIIMLSGKAHDPEAAASKADAYMLKPYMPQDLIDQIERLVN